MQKNIVNIFFSDLRLMRQFLSSQHQPTEMLWGLLFKLLWLFPLYVFRPGKEENP